MTQTSENTWQAQYAALIHASTAKYTRRAYQRDIAYFWAWAQLALSQPEHYPVSEDTVIRFVLAHVGQSPETEARLIATGLKRKSSPLKLSTLRRYLASLSVAHQEAGVASPTLSPKVKILLRRARQASADQAAHKKAAITKGVLSAILKTCDESLMGVRDRAILLVGFASGGRRRDEIAHLRWTAGIFCMCGAAKPIKAAKGLRCPSWAKRATALTAWLVQSGLRSGCPSAASVTPGNSMPVSADAR